MTKQHMKKNAHHPAIKEVQIKATPRFHLTPIRIATMENNANDKCWQGYRKKEFSNTAGRNVSYYNHYGKQYRGSLKN
jgi:hypothetical protein